ncbi:unnamed protein product [Lactuca virosa]|uniref:Uncharacterized protein n=1 Tax=Lactuca virosa TaxID=75947 RepID=A0AAU9MDD3_9ASTR|nr:unnamed protein product [Lactuca virosa]
MMNRWWCLLVLDDGFGFWYDDIRVEICVLSVVLGGSRWMFRTSISKFKAPTFHVLRLEVSELDHNHQEIKK